MLGCVKSLSERNTPADDPRQLAWHFSKTYFALRLGLAALAFSFPLFLWWYGKLVHGLDMQASMSAYFWAAADAKQCAAFPMRTFFAGYLFAIASGLFLYSGLTHLENWLLNAAGVSAALVAIYPEALGGRESAVNTCAAVKEWATGPGDPLQTHFVAAVVLFALLALVAWRCAGQSLKYLPEAAKDKEPLYRRAYLVLAAAMGFGPLFAIGVLRFVDFPNAAFFAEWLGIWTFGAYWAVKTRELQLSRLDRQPEAAVENAKA